MLGKCSGLGSYNHATKEPLVQSSSLPTKRPQHLDKTPVGGRSSRKGLLIKELEKTSGFR